MRTAGASFDGDAWRLGAEAAAVGERAAGKVMKLGTIGGRLAGVVMLASAVFAVAVIWLLLTDPVALTKAVASGAVGPLARALLDVFNQAFRGMLRWL